MVRFVSLGARHREDTPEAARGAEPHDDHRLEPEGLKVGKEVGAPMSLEAERAPPDYRQPMKGAAAAGLVARHLAEHRQQLPHAMADRFGGVGSAGRRDDVVSVPLA